MTDKPRRNKVELECYCCGQPAGKYYQWHDRDNGFGVCKTCVELGTISKATRMAGLPGMHRPWREDELSSVLVTEDQ